MNFENNHSFVVCENNKYGNRRDKIKIIKINDRNFGYNYSFIISNMNKCENGRNNICVIETSDWALLLVVRLLYL